MRLALLLLLSSGGPSAPRREGLVVNRRARQRARQPLADQQQTSTLETEDFGLASTLDTLDNGYSPARRISDFGYSDRVGYGSRTGGEDFGYIQVRNRARARTRAPVYSDTSEQTTAAAAPSESRRIRVRSRMRARLPRRQGSQEQETQPSNPQPKELYRDERTIVATEAPTRSRSRSRSRQRLSIPSREAPTTEGFSEQRGTSSRLSRGRLRERGGGVENQVRDTKFTSPRRIQDNFSSRRSSVSARDKAEPSIRAQRPKEPPRSSLSSPRIRFPKKNLFGTKAKTHSFSRENSIESSPRSLAKSSPRAIAKELVKGDKRSKANRSRGRGEDIQPSKPIRPRGPSRERNDELRSPEVQSSHREREVPTAITVTHQVPSRTVFTVVESGQTKSLFADTFETSLEVVAVSDLKSTEINSHRVVYAHVQTNLPSFGVTEMEFEVIQPTRTYREEERSFRLGGSETQVVEQIPYTVYNVEKITARVTNTPTLAVGNLGLEALSDPGQLGALLQNVLLSILGGGLLRGAGPTIQPGPPKTQLITHTRSFLTTITSLETIQIPVNFRGSTIFQTVTDQKTDLVTVTDYSVQTVLNYEQAKSQPFLPLAPTLHRAARVVPASPPPLNILPILQTSPPQLQTSLLTQTETVTSTVTSLATSQILLTLGGREITTEIVEPVTEVVTSTVLSTQSVLVAESPKASPTRSLRQLQLLQAILGLRRA